MGEDKDRDAVETKAAIAEQMQQRLKAAEEEFRKRLETPMTTAEARKALAEVRLREAQLNLARQNMLGQIGQIDGELAAVQMKRAEIAYRLTVPSAGTPEDGGEA